MHHLCTRLFLSLAGLLGLYLFHEHSLLIALLLLTLLYITLRKA